MTAPDLRGPTAVYRLHDDSGVLLYVGASKYPDRRFASHASNQEWWPQVTTITIKWFDSRSLALAAEAEAIRTEFPKSNPVPFTEDERVGRAVGHSSSTLAWWRGQTDKAFGGRLDEHLRAWRAEGLSYEDISLRISRSRGQAAYKPRPETVRMWCVDIDTDLVLEMEQSA